MPILWKDESEEERVSGWEESLGFLLVGIIALFVAVKIVVWAASR